VIDPRANVCPADYLDGYARRDVGACLQNHLWPVRRKLESLERHIDPGPARSGGHDASLRFLLGWEISDSHRQEQGLASDQSLVASEREQGQGSVVGG
jgi:hypothetical protein